MSLTSRDQRLQPEPELAEAFERAVGVLQRSKLRSQSELLRANVQAAVAELAVAAADAPPGTPLPAGAGPTLAALMQPARGPIVVRGALDAVNAILPALRTFDGANRGAWTRDLLAGSDLADAVLFLIGSGSEETTWRAARALTSLLSISGASLPLGLPTRMGPVVAALAAGMRCGGAARATAARARRKAAADFKIYDIFRLLPEDNLPGFCTLAASCLASVGAGSAMSASDELCTAAAALMQHPDGYMALNALGLLAELASAGGAARVAAEPRVSEAVAFRLAHYSCEEDSANGVGLLFLIRLLAALGPAWGEALVLPSAAAPTLAFGLVVVAGAAELQRLKGHSSVQHGKEQLLRLEHQSEERQRAGAEPKLPAEQPQADTQQAEGQPAAGQPQATAQATLQLAAEDSTDCAAAYQSAEAAVCATAVAIDKLVFMNDRPETEEEAAAEAAAGEEASKAAVTAAESAAVAAEGAASEAAEAAAVKASLAKYAKLWIAQGALFDEEAHVAACAAGLLVPLRALLSASPDAALEMVAKGVIVSGLLSTRTAGALPAAPLCRALLAASTSGGGGGGGGNSGGCGDGGRPNMLRLLTSCRDWFDYSQLQAGSNSSSGGKPSGGAEAAACPTAGTEAEARALDCTAGLEALAAAPGGARMIWRDCPALALGGAAALASGHPAMACVAPRLARVLRLLAAEAEAQAQAEAQAGASVGAEAEAAGAEGKQAAEPAGPAANHQEASGAPATPPAAAGEARAELEALLPRAIQAAEALAAPPPRASPPDAAKTGRRDASSKSDAGGGAGGSGSGSGKGGATCCAGCGSARCCDSGPLLRCVGCKAQHYCGDACATAHWPVHRAACRRVQRKRAAAAAAAEAAAAAGEGGSGM
ncbi:hypothetical protein Rsub_04443 [Raphidocelis subcapitata]|uniref:MYND-type domain-containing protein n=1 Tax=Raphidocelis subcapitata TaxID=307507 RepID=A0A2V0NWU6_9CHLO|nr:hypothetical protein Rsub_04443 [Raphidocelis subcapitata]|eukprot:GBF92096.1 hypothetical protein Rsub_04443 [Raphidocelis subcapitata]